MVPAGQRNKHLTIQSATETRDATYGEPVPVWGTFCMAWSRIRYDGGSEGLEAGAVRTERRAEIMMLYNSRITEKMRGLLGTTVFEFESVENVNESNAETRIMAVVRG